MQDLNDFYFFAAVVDHGGFAPAGRALGIQKSKLSRRVALLEERLGMRLLNRSSRSFSVTEIGREVYTHCKAMLKDAEAAEQAVAVAHDQPQGLLRISCPTALLSFQFGELLARFMVRYPAVQLYLESTNRRVDVIGEGFDLAIRVRFPPLEASDLVMRQLDESSQCLVAARSWPGGAVTDPAELSGVPSLDAVRPDREHGWTLYNQKGEVFTVPIAPRIVTDDMTVLRKAAIAGVGVVQLPTAMIWEDIRAGRLIHVLPEWRPKSGIVHAVFPSRRGLLPSVRSLLDFLAAECALNRAQANRIVWPQEGSP